MTYLTLYLSIGFIIDLFTRFFLVGEEYELRRHIGAIVMWPIYLGLVFINRIGSGKNG